MVPKRSIKQALDQGMLQLSHTDTAKLECEILMSNVVQKRREYLYSHPEYLLDATEYSNFNSLVKKRARGFPVAYLTGSREFWSIDINVNKYTLIPRPETESLVELVLKVTEAENKQKILDLGTGSGAIAIALAREKPMSQITAIDICPHALDMAKDNANKNNVSNIDFLLSDWFSEINQTKFDIIISNPPYVESDSPGFINGDIRYEPRLALDGGTKGMDAYIRIIPSAISYLKPGGMIVLEHGYLQGGMIHNCLSGNGYYDIQTIKDYAGNDRVSTGKI